MDSLVARLRASTHPTLADILPLDAVPYDVAQAELHLAPDNSFVETPSGPAARQLKRHADLLYGVGPALRSPYAITGFVNQYGRHMYRVGNRALSPPHTLSPPRPQTTTSALPAHRKLRKTRSFGSGHQSSHQDHQPPAQLAGRAHSHSVTSADVSRFTSLASLIASPRQVPSPHPHPVPTPRDGSLFQQGTASSDVFAQVMKWKATSASRRHSYANPSTASFSSMATTCSSSDQHDRAYVQHPFGVGVAFDSPLRRSPRVKRNNSQTSVTHDVRPDSAASSLEQHPAIPSRLVMPPFKMLREMQSFESTMTARQVDIAEPDTALGTPTAAISPGSPWHRLLDRYDDNPSLKRPPSAVLLRNVVPAPGMNAGLTLPDTPEANDDHGSDPRPSTPVVPHVPITNDLTMTTTTTTTTTTTATTATATMTMTPTMTTTTIIQDLHQALTQAMPIPHENENRMHDNTQIPPSPPHSPNEAGSRYASTPDVFDVLQTYTGLPLLDRLPTRSGTSTRRASLVSGGGAKGDRGTNDTNNTATGEDEGDDEEGEDDDLMVETTVIRMSLTAKEESAAPRDDPRFVIWGWVSVGQDSSTREVPDNNNNKKEREKKSKSWRGSLLSGSDGDRLSDRESSHASNGKGSRKSRPSLGRRRSKKDKKGAVVNDFGAVSGGDGGGDPDGGSATADRYDSSTSSGKKKVLIAATIERWVAQLTSEIDYDELLVFFLTYRTYVSATDLCRVLFGRFYWALRGEDDEGCGGRGEPVGGTKVCEERVRRIVRVRTFVAIRYWLIQFWPVDFVPNRELRLLMADCLNQLNRDPLLKKHVDGLGIVKRLIKAAKERRRAMFAKTGSEPSAEDHGVESDVDLDFMPEEQGAAPTRAGELLGSSTGAISSGFVMAPASLGSNVALQGAESHHHALRSVHALSHPHGALSRVVRTFGRWKRALNSRATSTSVITAPIDGLLGHASGGGSGSGSGSGGGGGGGMGGGANEFGVVSAFELDTSGDRSSASIRGSVERYTLSAVLPLSAPGKGLAVGKSALSAVAATGASPNAGSMPPTLPPLSLPSLSMSPPSSPVELDARGDASPVVNLPATNASAAASSPVSPAGGVDGMQSDASSDTENAKAERESEPVDSGVEIGTMADVEDTDDADVEAMSDRAESLRSASTNSFGVLLSATRGPPPLFANVPSPWPFDVVSIDDLELSDTSSTKAPAAPPGLRKAVRKLPKKSLFWPRESVSSMGIISHESMTSGPSSSGMSSPTGMTLGGKIEPWQLQDLLKSLRADEEEEEGGVDAALKRLEGYIDPQKQEEKNRNVNDWITNIQKRMEAGDYNNDDVDDPQYSYEEELIEFDDGERASHRGSTINDGDDGDDDGQVPTAPASPVVEPVNINVGEEEHGLSTRPPNNTPIQSQAPSVVTLGSPRIPDAVPSVILQSRMPALASPPLVPSAFSSPLPRLHQSFIVSYRAEALALHFAMIDSELFTCIRFEELVSAEWTACQEVNVLDWNQYLRDRARWKAEQRFPEKTNTLAAVRARFNLMTNFVISEVILTPPSARVLVFKKFLTVAYKSYMMNNFHALTAILTGLSHELVYKSLGRWWSRISRREHRMLTDFQKLISNVDEFRCMRNVIDSIAQAKPLDDSSHTSSVISGGTESKHKHDARPASPPACIPFIGVYLAQLHRLGELPDLIDPTAPHLAMEIDPVTGTCCPPRYPDVFSALAPLPSFIQLEPLINIHKQRQISAVIRSLITGQQLARRVHFDVDKKLFHKCLRLRASDIGVLQRVLDKYPD